MSDSFYNVLELDESAGIDEIKKSYRRLSMMYHPDRNKNNQDATAKFQKISEAYETLGDHEKKREYDAMRNNPFVKMMNGLGNSEQNPMEDLFANLFGGTPLGHMPSFGPCKGPYPFAGNVRIFHNGIHVNPQGFAKGMEKPSPIIKTLLRY